ncbi:hypothetical protein PALB_7350 [Pseudoalteromonas luteoviolacea B = ATCC 29581]|nr:hypothetical protein PALB_7350 [Pseudoalteromonas luteoviolacea B = ATCC 29581]
MSNARELLRKFVWFTDLERYLGHTDSFEIMVGNEIACEKNTLTLPMHCLSVTEKQQLWKIVNYLNFGSEVEKSI